MLIVRKMTDSTGSYWVAADSVSDADEGRTVKRFDGSFAHLRARVWYFIHFKQYS